MPWIATKDIGAYAAIRLAARNFSGSSVQEPQGQRDISTNEAASIVGRSIGMPNLAYVQVPSTMLGQGLVDSLGKKYDAQDPRVIRHRGVCPCVSTVAVAVATTIR